MSDHESKSKKIKEHLMWDSKSVVLMCILYGFWRLEFLPEISNGAEILYDGALVHNFCPLELYIRTQITITKQPDKLSGSYSGIWVMIIEKNFGNLKIEFRPLDLTTRRSKTWRSRFSGLSRQFLTLKMSDHESKSKKIEVVPDGRQQELCFDVYIIWGITT